MPVEAPLKQWLNLLRRRFPQAQAVYALARTLSDPQAVLDCLALHPVGRPGVDPEPHSVLAQV